MTEEEWEQAQASVGWFIILMCIIVILLVILIIACIVQRSRGQMYPGMCLGQLSLLPSAGLEYTAVK